MPGNLRPLGLKMIKLNPLYFPSSKSLVVLGRNKLNGTDGIMPLLLELAIKEKKQLLFFVSNYPHAYKAIMDNIVFRDILFKYGYLYLLGGLNSIKFVRYIIGIVQLFFIFLHGIAGGKIIHYGEMNNFPFRLLRIAYGKKVFLIENNTNETFYSEAHQEITRIITGRIMNKKTRNYLFNSTCKDDRIIYRKSTMQKYEKESKYNFYFYGRSRSRPIWLDYLMNNREKYFNKYHADIGDKKFIVIIGTSYDIFYNKIPEVFFKMLDVFEKDFSDQYFLYKPHPLIDNERILSEYRKRNLNFEVTYLHPNLLAMQAIAFVGNSFSNIMTDSSLLNVPTIEFANYVDELLEITGGTSISVPNKFVDYFIMKDQNLFRDALKKVVENSPHIVFDLNKVRVDESSASEVLKLLA